MLDDIDTREKVIHPSYKYMEQLDFQILLTDNYYVNPNSIHICFPIKIFKKSNNASDIDSNMITVNNFFAHWVIEIGITKYGSDKELPPTLSLWEVYQYSDQMLKHLPKDVPKTIQKTLLFSKTLVYFAKVGYDRRNYNSKGFTYTGLNAADTSAPKQAHTKDLNIGQRLSLFQEQLKN